MRQLLITLAATTALAASASAAEGLTAEQRFTLVSFGGPTIIADRLIQDELGLDENARNWVDSQLARTLEAHRNAATRFDHIRRQAQLAEHVPGIIAKPIGSESAHIEAAQKKVLDSFRDNLTGPLSPAQIVRLDQLAMQALGLGAFVSEVVRKKLKISKTQRLEIEEVLRTCQLDRDRIASGRGPDVVAKILARNHEAYNAVMNVFTEEQGEIWQAMVGPARRVVATSRP